jgi:hypothetical protein
MSFFNQILNGNIPINVVQSVECFQQDYLLNKQYSHYQLNEHMSNIVDNDKLLNSPYGAYVSASLKLDRQKVKLGLYKLLDIATSNAILKNKDELSGNLTKDVIKQFEKDISNNILILINQLGISDNDKKFLIHIIHLTGITNKNKNEMDDIKQKIKLNLELSDTFMTSKTIDLSTSLTIELKKNKDKCKKIVRNCIFSDDFLSRFTIALLDNIEHILSNIMNSAKQDKINMIYAYGVLIADALSQINNKNHIIETFGISIGNSKQLSDTKKVQDVKEVSKEIDQSKVINGITNMVSQAVNDVATKNSADLFRTIAVANKISVSGARGGSFTFSNIKQTVTADTQVKSEFVQSITSKIQNDMAAKLAEQIDMATKQLDSEITKLSESSKSGSSVEGMLGKLATAAASLGGSIVDGIKETLSVGIGNSVKEKKEVDISQGLKDRFKLDQSFKYEKTDDVSNAVSNILKAENLSKCASESTVANTVDLSQIDVTGDITISNLEQNAVVKDVMNCAFNQTVLTEIATKMFNSYDKLIQNMIENTRQSLSETERTDIQGDIYAVGTAGAAVLQGIGEAAKGIGEGVSTGAKGIGEGVSTGAQGIGKGIGSAFTGLMMPLIIGGVFIILLIVGYVIFKIVTKKSNVEIDLPEVGDTSEMPDVELPKVESGDVDLSATSAVDVSGDVDLSATSVVDTGVATGVATGVDTGVATGDVGDVGDVGDETSEIISAVPTKLKYLFR